jgi:hypothetical protein
MPFRLRQIDGLCRLNESAARARKEKLDERNRPAIATLAT